LGGREKCWERKVLRKKPRAKRTVTVGATQNKFGAFLDTRRGTSPRRRNLLGGRKIDDGSGTRPRYAGREDYRTGKTSPASKQ